MDRIPVIHISPRAACEPGALDGWKVVCEACGFVAGDSLQVNARLISEAHARWHMRRQRNRRAAE